MGGNTQHPKVQEVGRSIICLLHLQQLNIFSGHVRISKSLQYLSLGYFNPDGLPELIPSLHEWLFWQNEMKDNEWWLSQCCCWDLPQHCILHPPLLPILSANNQTKLLYCTARAGRGKNRAIKAETILRKRKPQKSVPAIPAVLSLPAAFPSESSLDLTWVGKRL